LTSLVVTVSFNLDNPDEQRLYEHLAKANKKSTELKRLALQALRDKAPESASPQTLEAWMPTLQSVIRATIEAFESRTTPEGPPPDKDESENPTKPRLKNSLMI
jgi:hypothetical protein